MMKKGKLLDMLKEGKSFATLARYYGVNESTLRYIKKDGANICKTAAITVSTEAKHVATPRNERTVKMETALALWITDFWKKNVSLDSNMIRTKTKSLYDKALPDDDNEGDAEGETGQSLASTSSATRDSSL